MTIWFVCSNVPGVLPASSASPGLQLVSLPDALLPASGVPPSAGPELPGHHAEHSLPCVGLGAKQCGLRLPSLADPWGNCHLVLPLPSSKTVSRFSDLSKGHLGAGMGEVPLLSRGAKSGPRAWVTAPCICLAFSTHHPSLLPSWALGCHSPTYHLPPF